MKTKLIPTITILACITTILLSCQEKEHHKKPTQPDLPLTMPNPRIFLTDYKIEWDTTLNKELKETK